MRLCSALTALCLVALSGCSTPSSHEAYDRCSISKAEGWELVSPPQNSAELLSMPSPPRGRPIGSELISTNSRQKVHEHWFQRSPDEIEACRHNLVRDECARESAVARFVRSEGRWVIPDEAFLSICVTGYKGAETSDTSLERTRGR